MINIFPCMLLIRCLASIELAMILGGLPATMALLWVLLKIGLTNIRIAPISYLRYLLYYVQS
uniref:Uncharacterized protein n=1 Tax=Lophocladia kuetzingii TaxID=675577 RepID=A0A1Z1MNP7_9FLOR|nr:hypothetical protein [Lophocladia kuetzingii]ARW67688.1 hypothetical protein [Lophocladia kuetzingii]